ncbi:uncharacterized protein K460DRAFT_373981 [Cucurbitaria berberidis CBS 394.84]|uniref:Uncharacterized protein n=1 Tax=Cucurbitaria berberidis CBS 394.84 TaxID=1168544 RepID=A0A9P4GT88_9PLEO|nr:uncharacterized protein K460DRAFT_373981 [Cucurbitaria berberidis CBS 394.84]KAF1852133.1 hypothetical protein K460DRAFT_373981 [Cucurbitaria berberidis CBS 394.84]
MDQQLTLNIMAALDLEPKPLGLQSYPDSTLKKNDQGSWNSAVDNSSGQFHKRRHSNSTFDDSAATSRSTSRSSSPRPSLPSSTTTPSLCTNESFVGFNTTSTRRPSALSWLRSSISTASTSTTVSRRAMFPADFQTRPEHPEKHFVDAIGVFLPGVCDRTQCTNSRAHFVSTFRLCEPIEYTTALADHGITYTDYCRLVTALSNFLDEITSDSKHKKKSRDVGGTTSSPPQKNVFFDTTEQLDKARQHADALNRLLEEITWNIQARGVPVTISVNSFSLFAPHRISEAHIQILHVTLEQMLQAGLEPDITPGVGTTDPNEEDRLSFIDMSALVGFEERSLLSKLEGQIVSASTHTKEPRHQHQRTKIRDRSRPAPLWPNAIPSRKRPIMSANADRYGVDPYFRAWMRANINSRTQTNTYAKYMIEQEDDIFVNKRLEYTVSTSRGALIMDVLVNGTQAWKEHYASTVNRTKYEHNRRLECRRNVERGSRLRILRFGFRHSIYPPHTPEMSALGLTKGAYQTIISNIESIQTHAQLSTHDSRLSCLMASLNKLRRRGTEDALMKVSEYLRELNASQRRIVWTIEKIPGVYDRGLARDRTEWEISAWNGEDPLELVLQLEKWGIIENRLGVDDDE